MDSSCQKNIMTRCIVIVVALLAMKPFICDAFAPNDLTMNPPCMARYPAPIHINPPYMTRYPAHINIHDQKLRKRSGAQLSMSNIAADSSDSENKSFLQKLKGAVPPSNERKKTYSISLNVFLHPFQLYYST